MAEQTPTPDFISLFGPHIGAWVTLAFSVLTVTMAVASRWIPGLKWVFNRFTSEERLAEAASARASIEQRDAMNKMAFDRLKADLAVADQDIKRKDDELQVERDKTAAERQKAQIERDYGNKWYQIAFGWFSLLHEYRVLVMGALKDADIRLRAAGLPGIEAKKLDTPNFEDIVEFRSKKAKSNDDNGVL